MQYGEFSPLAGRHQVLATETMFPGESRRDITTESGRTHFFVARPSARRDAVTGMTYMGGLVGMAAASVVTAGSDNAGPIDFFPWMKPPRGPPSPDFNRRNSDRKLAIGRQRARARVDWYGRRPAENAATGRLARIRG